MKKLAVVFFLSSFAYGGLDANLVLHYKMNDNASNTTVLDSKGFSNGTAQRNTNLISVPGIIGNSFSFNPCLNSITVTGSLNPDASGTYLLTGGLNLKPVYQKAGGYSVIYNNGFWYITGNSGNWKSESSNINGNYNAVTPTYNALVVNGNITPELGLNGIYVYAGLYEVKPYYAMPYDIWFEGEHYTGHYNIFWDGSYWTIGELAYNNKLLRSALQTGDYTPIEGSGVTGTATITGEPIDGVASIADVNLIVDTDYINTNLSSAQMKSIFQHDFTLSCWIKTLNFSGSCLAGASNGNAVDFASLFMAMGYDSGGFYFNQHNSSTSPWNEIPSIYKNKWTMFTCSVEQTTPFTITIKQYLDDSLILTDTANFVLAHWGESIAPNNSLYIGAYNGYTTPGIATEYMGYGAGCAFDNFMIFNKALKRDEVALLYNNGSGRENVFSDCNEVQSSNNGMLSDFNKDCRVDFLDLGRFALEWMICNDPRDIECKAD